MRNGVDENTVAALWRELVAAGYEFTADNRQPVRVRYPGRDGAGVGGDVRQAALELDGVKTCGDIEFHVHAGDWRRHGHHRDRHYNTVALQVVMWQKSGEPAFLENGQYLPTVAIGNFYDGLKQCGLETTPGRYLPCLRLGERQPARVIGILEAAAGARFREKAAALYEPAVPPAESLYRGLMEALGYSQNRAPFRKLAASLPLSEIENCLNAGGNNTEALLSGTAGLLPASPADVYTQEISEIWHNLRHHPAVNYAEWSFYRLRPANFPARRLAGMRSLLARYRAPGLLAGLAETIRTTGDAPQLTTALSAPADVYWRNHYDYGKSCGGLSPWAIGAGRAAEMAVNAVLPFFYLYGQKQGDNTLAAKALAVYMNLPAGEENAVVKHMRAQIGLKQSLTGTGARQQGLLQLYKNCCAPGQCQSCPLNETF